MSSSFSDKPFGSHREPDPAPVHDESAIVRRDPGVRLNWRRLLAGFAVLFFGAGMLLLSFMRGGFFNQHYHWDGSHWVELNEPGHIVGFVLIGLSAVIVVFLFSLEKRP